ncbi:MAG TPA: outer membrane beta-barrel protein [Candidatus Kapabacteria bacterium]|jgi:hypothetical protein|nr:outer membrane beta-barrel protein [Candidatus Kapabacteria bacterium]
MRYFFCAVLLLASAALYIVDDASAQTEEQITFGVGVTFSPQAIPGDDEGRFGTAGMTNFSIPMQFGPYIRFEPEFGLFFKSYQEQLLDTATPNGIYVHTLDHQVVRAGFGVFYTRQPTSDFQFGLGGRMGVISSEYETHYEKAGIDDTDTHYGVFYLGGSLTVEYYFSRHFSIGGELQFIHYGYGSPLETVGSNPLSGYLNPTKEQSIWSTNETLSARFWF